MSEAGPAAKSRLSARAVAVVVLASGLAGVALALSIHAATTRSAARGTPARAGLIGDAVWAGGSEPAPTFTLLDQHSRFVSLSAQRGRTVVLAFMDSHCRIVCRVEGPLLGRIMDRAGGRALLMVVSVNPWQDTAASTGAAAAHWRLGHDWVWLRGSASRLRVIWNAYGIKVVRTRGDVSHSTAIYLIDRTGHERAGFNFPFTLADVLHDVRLLQAERRT